MKPTESVAFRLEDLSARWGIKIWNLIFDLPGEKVNKFTREVMAEFEGLLPRLEDLQKQGKIDLLVMTSGKPGNFIAGADINLIQAAKTSSDAMTLSRAGQMLLDRWEDLPFPTVVGIQGAAMGGGCELSLASTAIVVANDPATRIGLPEVMLGVVPGMGGCVRMPRKVGLATALDLILTGKTLNAERAYRGGLADAILPLENFSESVFQWAKTNFKALQEGRRLGKEPKLGGMGGAIGSALEHTSVGRSIMLKKARDGVMEKARGNYPAALEAIEVLRTTHGSFGDKIRGSDRTRAMEREAEGFGKCAATDVSKNLIRIFFLTEAVKKSKGVANLQKAGKPIDHGAVLGAGVMGGGIAQLLAEKNIPVRMKDLNIAALAAGETAAARIFKKQVQKKRISSREYLQKLNLIAPVMDFGGFQSVEIVVEAVVEKMDVKKKVLQELETQVGDSCILASNTSSLSISEMQTALKRPERFGGMHFFNPVSRMPLIEVIRGEKTSDETVSAIFQFSKQLGKTPIVVKDKPGFLVNRLLMPYLNEATWCLKDGASIAELDEALLEFGMPMGPMELIDEVGVDVGEKVAHILNDAFGERMMPAPFNHKVVEAGRLGKKNGKGFYVYDAQGKNKQLDPQIYELLGVAPQGGAIGKEELVERCILPMINEAARCLDEAVVESAEQVDLGMIMGTGFPPFRGGLLRYADSLGCKELLTRLERYEARFGKRFEAAPGIRRRAEAGQNFHG